MEAGDLLRYTVRVLERLGLPYLVTGSIATIFFGEPRFTNDIDIVVQLPVDRVAELCNAFPAEEFYVSEETAHRAIERGGQFNVVHPRSGLKVDLVVSRQTPFDQSRFARAIRVEPGSGFEASFATAEDVILKKMEYYREGGADKHLRDIAGVLRVSGDRIDRSYIHRWAEELGVDEIWTAIVNELPETR